MCFYAARAVTLPMPCTPTRQAQRVLYWTLVLAFPVIGFLLMVSSGLFLRCSRFAWVLWGRRSRAKELLNKENIMRTDLPAQ